MRRLLFLFLFIQSLAAQEHPNIIYIMSDDHDADAISAYNKKLISTPNIDRLARQGMLFNKNFVGNSICGPARATLLTGQHSHMNGMKDNRTRFDSSRITFPKLLLENGYQTAIVGKWHLQSLPQGFSYWKVLPGQGFYYNPRFINMGGDTGRINGYATDIITDLALDWIDKRDPEKPFMLMIHHKAPHRNFLPRLRWLKITSARTYPEPATLYANMNNHGKAWQIQKMSILHDMTLCSDLKVDPEIFTQLKNFIPDSADIRAYKFVINQFPEAERDAFRSIYAERGKQLINAWGNDSLVLKLKYQWYMQDYLACVASVDENIGRLLDFLDSKGLSKNTVILYTSDQGMYLGENGWFDKRWMYDVSMQSPLLVRWPSRVRAGTISNSMIQNIDYAPTFLDLAGIDPPDWMQGISFKPLLTGKMKTLPRNELYYHYYEYPIDHYVVPHLGIRNNKYKLIYFYTVNEWELYDLEKDPAEQRNLINSPFLKELIRQLKTRLIALRDQYGDHEKAGELN